MLLKNGETAKIIGMDSIAKKYKAMTSSNKPIDIEPDEIDQLAPDKFKDYQTSGVDRSEKSHLAIKKNNDIVVDRAA